jgi:hypothetical protein
MRRSIGGDLLPGLGGAAAAAEQVHHEEDYGKNEQNVNEGCGDVKYGEAQKPRNN